MISLVIGKEIYTISQIKLNNKRFSRYKFILNYSDLKIFRINTIKKDEIENFIEEELFTSYDKEEILLDYKKDKKNKETIIFMYRINEILRGLIEQKLKFKIIPIELVISKLIKNNGENIIFFEGNFIKFIIENNILKEIKIIEDLESISNNKILKFVVENNLVKEVRNEKIS